MLSDQPGAVFDNPALTEGEWAGWTPIRGHDPFEDQAGPFYFQVDAAGRHVCALKVDQQHLNGPGGVHGGCLMTLADMSLFAIAKNIINYEPAVTVSLSGDFVGPAGKGDLLLCTGEIVRAGGSLIFMRGLIFIDEERPVLSYAGTVKLLRRRKTS